MKTKVLVGILLFLIVINLSTIGVFVFHMLRGPKEAELMAPEGGRPAGMMAPESPMMRLQPEMRERMHKLMMSFREETRVLQQKIFVLEDSTVALLMKNDPPPMSRINDIQKEISDLRLLINQKAIHNLLQAKSFLPPEQQDMFFRAIMQARPQIGRYGPGMMGRGQMRGRQMPGRTDTIGPY
jgi:Spy/CpxP family protein refolding chaperone